MTKLHLFAKNLLFLLFLVYNFLLASAGEDGSLLMQVSIVLIILVCILYFVKTTIFLRKKSGFFYAWTALALLNIIGFIFTADYFDKRYYGPFLAVLACLLPFYPFYYFSSKNLLSSKNLVYFFLGMIPIAIYAFYQNQTEIIDSRINNDTNVVNNLSYLFVGLMPFVFLIKRSKIISVGLMAILLIFIIQGSKRGALIVGAFNLIIYLYYLFKIGDKRKKIQGYFISFTAAIVLSFLAYRYFLDNEYLFNRMSNITEGGGSGRDVIYMLILEGWYNSLDLSNLLFGYGFAESVSLTGGLLAHNDWLEALANFGLLGFLIYLILMFSAFKVSFNKKKWDFDKRILLKTIIFSWLMISMVSMWYTNINGYTQSILLAYLVGNNVRTIE